jgi:hypothetical protein
MSKLPLAALFSLMLVVDVAMFDAHASRGCWIGMLLAGLGALSFTFLLFVLALDKTLR